MTLIEAFSKVRDPRRSKGLRTRIDQIFSMVVISNLCGYIGYRPVANFCKANENLLSQELGLKHGVPSHVTFREVFLRTDSHELISCFNEWAKIYVPMIEGAWVSGDGKALGSTVEDMHGNKQDFQAVVSLFCHESGMVSLIGHYRNAKKSEAYVLRSLLEHFRGAGVIIRLDALHTQKNG